jgi:gag-polypeptide of LTR copia-type
MNTQQVQSQHEEHEVHEHEQHVHEHEQHVHEQGGLPQHVQGQQVMQQVQEQKQEVQFDVDAETKKLTMDRDYINKAIQMASTNKFTGEHYLLWREIIDGILLAADLWCLFDENQFKQLRIIRSPAYITSKRINARMVILTGLSKEIASQYTSMKDPVELLNSLDIVYNSNTATTRSEIRKIFQQLHLDDYKTVSEYVETLKCTVQKMISMDVPVSDEEKIHQLFAGLPEEFGPTISYLRIANIRHFDTIVSTIRDCGVEWEKKQKQIANNDQVHYAGNNKNGRHRNKSNNN